jgi:hypothetical protein
MCADQRLELSAMIALYGSMGVAGSSLDMKNLFLSDGVTESRMRMIIAVLTSLHLSG